MTLINFKANYIKPVNICKVDTYGNTEPKEVSLIEFDIKNNDDIDALRKTALEWEKIAYGFAGDIYLDAVSGNNSTNKSKKIIGITEQKEDFDKVNSNKMLGVALLSGDDECSQIEALQVNPRTNYTNSYFRPYKNIGSQLVDYMKTIGTRPIKVYSMIDTVEFYEKQGFRRIDSNGSSLILEE